MKIASEMHNFTKKSFINTILNLELPKHNVEQLKQTYF